MRSEDINSAKNGGSGGGCGEIHSNSLLSLTHVKALIYMCLTLHHFYAIKVILMFVCMDSSH